VCLHGNNLNETNCQLISLVIVLHALIGILNDMTESAKNKQNTELYIILYLINLPSFNWLITIRLAVKRDLLQGTAGVDFCT
jgi:hypothetical protein